MYQIICMKLILIDFNLMSLKLIIYVQEILGIIDAKFIQLAFSHIPKTL